jgi:sulfatase maturation enzyme AslB (radical SAM superfamily)
MMPDKLISLWEHFKEVRIGASIDGVGEVFNYQRTPANFDAVYKNLLKLDSNDRIKLKGWFAFTVTPFNVFHFPEFMKWKLTESGLHRFNSDDARPIVSHHMCHSPKYYNIKVLPMNIKIKLKAHYQNYIDWVNTTDLSANVKKDFAKILNGVVKFMMSEDYSEQWLEEFINHTVKLDKIRDQNIIDIVPQYKEMFDAHNK